MIDTRATQGGHKVEVRTTERVVPAQELRTTCVNGKAVSMADRNARAGQTRE